MIKGRWPSGKAQVFGTCMRRFESYPPCLLFDTVTESIFRRHIKVQTHVI